MNNIKYVIMYPSLPGSKDVDLYVATFGGVTENLEPAHKFADAVAAASYASGIDKGGKPSCDDEHGPPEIWTVKTTTLLKKVEKQRSMPTEIKEKEAVEQLVKFIREDADLDDIAQLFSDFISDDICRVISIDGEHVTSDPYLNGERTKEADKKLELTPEQMRAYLVTRGGQCPLCKSTDIEGTGSGNTDANWHSESVRCNYCGAEWDDIYTLSDVELTSRGDD